MKNNEEDRKKLPTSFTVGAIALIFLATGYQTALFVIRASRARIEASLDRPDTVFVYVQESSAVPGTEDSGGEHDTEHGNGGESRSSLSGRKAHATGIRYERKNASRGTASTAIRAEALARRPPESFPFDPNTASAEDFVRLGFSPKQADAIIRYRNAGGRFRRREDFAKSYVVEDSVYARLEKWIIIPKTDINAADSAAFDALPGIGPYFAAKMVSYRKRLKGYSHTEQLMDIPRFDEEKYERLKDLVEAGPHEPYPLWTLPEDSLELHPYIGRHAAHGIVVFRENNPKEKLTVNELGKAGVLTAENARKLGICLIAEP